MEEQDKGASLRDRVTAAEPVVSALRDGVPSALDEAICLAATAHAGQLDKGGQPYILHALRVMLACKADADRIVAVLHDTLEDTDTPFSLLWKKFGADIAEAVNVLTRYPGEDYTAFIDRVAQHDVARRVKIADLRDNMDLTRLGREPTMSDARRQMKYADALNTLLNAEMLATQQGAPE